MRDLSVGDVVRRSKDQIVKMTTMNNTNHFNYNENGIVISLSTITYHIKWGCHFSFVAKSDVRLVKRGD